MSHFVARRLERDSLYSGWLRRQGEHIVHGTDRLVECQGLVESTLQSCPLFSFFPAPECPVYFFIFFNQLKFSGDNNCQPLIKIISLIKAK